MVVKKTTKKVSKSKATKSSKKSAPAAPPAAPVAAAPAESKESTTPTLSEAFSDLLGQLASLRTQLTAVTTQARQLSKRSERELRAAMKASRKRPRKSGTRQPSGFVKPTLISKELANFLGKEVGTEMARTDVSKEINAYIRTHKLQDPKNGRIIKPDTKLQALLNIKKGDELTYFNLQRYMSPHFPKTA